MRHTVYKIFFEFQYEKEEKWLNEMSAKGMALVSGGICRYVFEDCTPGEYIYRIEYLGSRAAHPENIAYIRFLEETGIEHVSSILHWVYLRKKSADGPFQLYSDIDSKIKYSRRLQLLFLILMLFETVVGVFSIVAAMTPGNPLRAVNMFFGILCIILALMLLLTWRRQSAKIKKLKKEKQLRE